MNRFLFLFSLFSCVSLFAQNDCVDAIVVCGNSGFSGLSATGVGTQELNGHVTCGSDENNSIWLRLDISTSGTLAFNLIPTNEDIDVDFDFFIFGPDVSCNNIGMSIRCSTTNPLSIGQENNWTGLRDDETDTSEGPGGNGDSFLKPLDVIAGESYFLVIDRPVGSSDFTIEWNGTSTFNSPPTIQIPQANAIDLSQCDTDGVADGMTIFNLSQNDAIVIGSQPDVAVTYHINENDAITGDNAILAPGAFPNTSNPQMLYVRITNTATGCYNYTSFNLSINNVISIPNNLANACDDAADGDDDNGQTLFNLDNVTSQLFNGQDTSSFTTTYYPTQNDLDHDTNALGNTFYNTIPGQQDLFVKATSSGGCTGTRQVTLIVLPLPQKKTATLVQCDTGISPDGLTLFDVTQATDTLLSGNGSLSVSYYANVTDAGLDQNELGFYTNTSNPQQIIAKITDTLSGCSSLSTVNLIVNTTPSQNEVISSCDVLGQENGLTTFNLDSQHFSMASGETIAYYLNLDDALLETNAIPNTSAFPNTEPYHQVVYARIEDATGCSSINTLELVVNGLPKIKTTGDGDEIVCIDDPTKFIAIDAGLLEGLPSQFGYIWRRNGTIYPAYYNTIYVNLPGTYTVEVVNANGCRKVRTIEVMPSNKAVIGNVAIEDVTTDSNTVTIQLATGGSGTYEYSLDNPVGPFQDSNFFDGVTAGFHDVYVRDVNGCGTVTERIAVLGAPHFFTPNGDGINDTWMIKGIDAAFNTETNMYIFDRFGMMVKEIPKHDTGGWDGTYLGKPLPADDYWYVVHFQDGRISRGHFALKR